MVRLKWFDLAAVGASALCLAHCLMLPLLFALMPAATRLLQLPEAFHLGAFLFAIPVSAYVMRAGYQHHGVLAPAVFGGIGLVLLGAGAAGNLDLILETGVTVIGSTLLAIGHLRNWRLRQSGVGKDRFPSPPRGHETAAP